MNLQHLGTDYGGWTIDVDLLPEEGVIIDAGVGTDISFAQAVKSIRPKMRFVGVDHTDEAEAFVKAKALPDYNFIKAAVTGRPIYEVTMFKHRTRSGSESMFSDNYFTDPRAPYTVPAVHLAQLVRDLQPCLVKLDIEGAEYECFRDCFGVPQVCIEWHHRMMSIFKDSDTDRALDEFIAHGYELKIRTKTDEVLLVRK